MLSWDQILDLIASGELQDLKRTPRVAELYQQYRADLAEQHTTVVDAVIDRKLCWDRRELAALDARLPTPEARAAAILSDPTLYKLLPNDFPYDFDPRVSHLVLWSKVRIPLYKHCGSREMVPAVYDKIQSFLQEKLRPHGVRHFTWFINYPHLQSVKAVSHIHILIYTENTHVISDILESGFRK
ncbi:LAQU0S16e02124g1_1 [Lachancea quebecensis]|uniref:LAQU0S16e02124g1_1 n=1 Tax=Lachancea quebecensis TaxID=1654605 RepID=A0A0P1L2H6_9SACH|nr:LAQU0S16e02124g1_1 [Lachancea quebecensis]